MGLLGKLLNRNKDELDEYNSRETSAKSEPGMLRTARTGGYDKMMTLAAIDSYSKEILALTEAVEAKKNGEPYTPPAEAPAVAIPTVRAGGFNESDVDAHIQTLKDTIIGLRSQL